jgi:UDP-N-acetylglucosamine 1-carboxyvinyltransferase
MGASITLERGYVHAHAPSNGGPRLRGTDFCFDTVSVTGTENLMMAAALARGRTTLINCAREPEVEELGRVLNKMGAEVQGAGTSEIRIEGRDEIQPFDHAIISDRIEAATFMIAAAATGGDVVVEAAPVEHLETFVAKLRSAGVQITSEQQGLRVRRSRPLAPVDVTTAPYPGFPTDLQAQFMVLMCLAKGRSAITETIFENRFMHVSELARMGADIDVRGNTAIVHGVEGLSGASVMATDLRASASLVIAGLIATDFDTDVRRVYHLDRGYERIEQKLGRLGADIQRVPDSPA